MTDHTEFRFRWNYGTHCLLPLLVLLAVISLIYMAAAMRQGNRYTQTQSADSKADSKMPPMKSETESSSTAWHDSVAFRAPRDKVGLERTTRAVNWLKQHRVVIHRQGADCEIHVIAWKDPTLEPTDPDLLAGYLITDTLWAAKALKVFDPIMAGELESSLQCQGWYGNGLHDVLFHPLERILHRPADEDFVHGSSLGRFAVADGQTIDVRVMRQKWDANFNSGHPRQFAEHAIYQALFDYWQGRTEQARARVLNAVEDHRNADAKDRIFWDSKAWIVVDDVTFDDWTAFQEGVRKDCRHCTFKLALLLYAIRLLNLEEPLEPLLPGMRQRLWDAQHETGGLAHFIDVRSAGMFVRGVGSTGEASAVAILSEIVTVHPVHESGE